MDGLAKRLQEIASILVKGGERLYTCGYTASVVPWFVGSIADRRTWRRSRARMGARSALLQQLPLVGLPARVVTNYHRVLADT